MTIQFEGSDCTDHVLTTCANGSLNNETEISEPAHRLLQKLYTVTKNKELKDNILNC